MSTLVVLRHGESTWNREKRFQGWTDVELTDRGRRQADLAGRTLAAHGFAFDACFTSRLKRATDTLAIVLRAMEQESIPGNECWRLNERHYGALQGLGRWEAVRRYGLIPMLRWQREFSTPPPAVDLNDPRHPRHDPRYGELDPSELPRAESLADTLRRLLPCWNEEIAPALASGKRVLVVAHHNTLRALVKHLEDISERNMLRVLIPIARPLVFDLDSSLRVVGRHYVKLVRARDATRVS
jgi:2,3-bisphosphoglycerate-dependent phosphoglycerate mutase